MPAATYPTPRELGGNFWSEFLPVPLLADFSVSQFFYLKKSFFLSFRADSPVAPSPKKFAFISAISGLILPRPGRTTAPSCNYFSKKLLTDFSPAPDAPERSEVPMPLSPRSPDSVYRDLSGFIGILTAYSSNFSPKKILTLF